MRFLESIADAIVNRSANFVGRGSPDPARVPDRKVSFLGSVL